eukprot:Lithocolla_globosa_v1_NODE_1106_length_2866_cov_12.933120.p1 type:complete len:430 gc:universal NODE_1106_length_2866_cov_12.933120:1535-2824(+)
MDETEKYDLALAEELDDDGDDSEESLDEVEQIMNLIEKGAELTLSQKIFLTFENPDYSNLAYATNIFVMVVIVFSTFTLIISSIPALADDRIWFVLETLVIAIFTLEYLARVITVPNKLSYITSPLNVIDLVAILPYYIELVVSAASTSTTNLGGLAVLRVLRLVRVLRLFKMGKNSAQLGLFVRAMRRSRNGIILLVFLLTLADIFFGTCVFYAETLYCELTDDGIWVYKETFFSSIFQPGDPTPFQNIPACLWWGVVTMTTVGYGDETPITPLGKIVGVMTMVAGLLVLAFPVTVIGQNLSDVYEDHKLKLAREKLLRKIKGIGERKGSKVFRSNSSIEPIPLVQGIGLPVVATTEQVQISHLCEKIAKIQVSINATDTIEDELIQKLTEQKALEKRYQEITQNLMRLTSGGGTVVPPKKRKSSKTD